MIEQSNKLKKAKKYYGISENENLPLEWYTPCETDEDERLAKVLKEWSESTGKCYPTEIIVDEMRELWNKAGVHFIEAQEIEPL